TAAGRSTPPDGVRKEPPMIRWIWQAAPTPSRTMTEDQFIHEVLALAGRSFAGVPQGPITIEAIDAEERICWRAYYRQPEELLGLVREICDERALSDRRGRRMGE